MEYREFFRKATGIEGELFPYQIRLAEEDWLELLDVPPGLARPLPWSWLGCGNGFRGTQTPRRNGSTWPMGRNRQ